MKKKRIILMMLSASFLAVSGTEYFGRLEASSLEIPESREDFVKSGVQATAVKLYSIYVSNTVTLLQQKEISDFFLKHKDLILGESSIREKLRDQMYDIVMKFDYAEARAKEAAEHREAEADRIEDRRELAKQARAKFRAEEMKKAEDACLEFRADSADVAAERERLELECGGREELNKKIEKINELIRLIRVAYIAARAELSDKLSEIENGVVEVSEVNCSELEKRFIDLHGRGLIFNEPQHCSVIRAFSEVFSAALRVKGCQDQVEFCTGSVIELNDSLLSAELDLLAEVEQLEVYNAVSVVFEQIFLDFIRIIRNPEEIKEIDGHQRALVLYVGGSTALAAAPGSAPAALAAAPGSAPAALAAAPGSTPAALAAAPGSAPTALVVAPGSASTALVVAPGSASTALVVAPGSAPAAPVAVNPDYAAAVVVLAAANVTPETMSRAHIKMLTPAQRSSVPGPLMSAAAGRR